MIRNTFFSYFSQEFLITEWLRLERISVGLLVQHPCSSRITYSRLPRPCPYGFWRAPRMETQQPLQATCARQCSITTQWRSASWCLDRALCSSLFPLPLTLSLGTTEKSMTLFSLHPPFSYLYTLIRSPEPYLLQVKQSQLSPVRRGDPVSSSSW